MKMKLFFRISVLVLCILMSLSSFADDKKDRISVEEIDWSKNNQSLESIHSTPDNPTKTYLYAYFSTKAFFSFIASSLVSAAIFFSAQLQNFPSVFSEL